MPDPVRFIYGPRLVLDAGASANLATWVPAGLVLFVADNILRGFGLIDTAVAGLESAGHVVTIFDAVEADPPPRP